MSEKVNVREALDQITSEICDKYCKYPDIWDEEKEGCELFESEVCQNCPVGRLS